MEPEPPGAASFCLEPEPESAPGPCHQEPEPPKKVAAPQHCYRPISGSKKRTGTRFN